MSAGRRKNDRGLPYAYLPPSLISTRRFQNYSPGAKRVWLWANADWSFKRPPPPPPPPALLLLSNSLPARLGMAKPALAAAIAELRLGGDLVLVRPAVRPGRQGSSDGAKAAEYDLPHRQLRASLRREVTDKVFDGAWRPWCDDLRTIVSQLDNRTVQVLTSVVLPQHRDRDGGVIPGKVTSFSAPDVVNALAGTAHPMSLRTVERAIADLMRLELVHLEIPGSGRRPARYLPAGLAADARKKRK